VQNKNQARPHYFAHGMMTGYSFGNGRMSSLPTWSGMVTESFMLRPGAHRSTIRKPSVVMPTDGSRRAVLSRLIF